MTCAGTFSNGTSVHTMRRNGNINTHGRDYRIRRPSSCTIWQSFRKYNFKNRTCDVLHSKVWDFVTVNTAATGVRLDFLRLFTLGESSTTLQIHGHKRSDTPAQIGDTVFFLPFRIVPGEESVCAQYCLPRIRNTETTGLTNVWKVCL